MKKFNLLLAVAAMTALCSNAATELTLQTDKPGAEVKPTMYGIFFEDINFAADGGLYAEKIKNRSFEFPQNLMGWQTFGDVELRDDGPFERNPHYVRLSMPDHSHKQTGLENEGFFGVSVKKGTEYRFSVWARSVNGEKAQIKVQLIDPTGHSGYQQISERAKIIITSPEWKKYEISLVAKETVRNGRLRILMSKPSAPVDLEHISLFPADTWGGMRRDLAQRLHDLRPGVFRFPGGCIVEGTDLATRYQWKNSVGPVENRPLNINRWNYTFDNHLFPDYFQTYGLGFYEYFVLSENFGAEPLPILNVGLACQYQNDDDSAHQPVDCLDEYIQDCLDLVEFANADTTTTWGALRGKMGHPEPFNMKYLGIGNEQWGPEYVERLEPFLKVMRERHPEIRIVGSSGPNSEGDDFDYLWPEMARLKVDLVDEHYYRPEDWFLKSAKRYDNYDRKGPKVFAGEYACHERHKQWNHFNAALMEAAFMTGLERNADIVEMATYAPLFAHVDGWQWRPDLIWFDNFDSFNTSSYYVQQLFSLNKGSNVLPLLDAGKKPLTGQHDLYGSAVYDADTDEYIVKLANTAEIDQEVTIDFAGLNKKAGIYGATITTLSCDDPDAENTIKNPNRIVPVTERVAIDNAQNWTTVIPAKSFRVYRFSK